MKCDICGQPLDEDKPSGKYPLSHYKCVKEGVDKPAQEITDGIHHAAHASAADEPNDER